MKLPVIWLSPAAARALAHGKMPSPRDVALIALQALALGVMVMVSATIMLPVLGFVGAGIAWAMGDPRPLAMGIALLRAMVGV